MTIIELRIRPHDCDSFGHVNNAVYVSLIEYALATGLARAGFASDWSRAGDYQWELREMNIEYRQPAQFGDGLVAAIWLLEPNPLDPVFGTEIGRAPESSAEQPVQPFVRARSVWARCLRQTGQASPLPQGLQAHFMRESGRLPRPFQLPTDSAPVWKYGWEHTVKCADVGLSGRTHPQAIYRWLEDALFDASAQGGWPTERRLAAGFLTLQTRHDTQFFAFPELGDRIRITSRIIEVRRLRGTWLHEIDRLPAREQLVRDYSSGVFLNLEGRPTAPPPEMMRELQYGE